ncbi:MAG: gliding motility-associated C-terminal domain-containing protein, partial [Flavobacteriales bacterium]
HMIRPLPVLLVAALSGTVFSARSHTHEHRNYEFVPNAGQEPASVKFSGKLKGGKMFFEEKSIVYQLMDNSCIQDHHEGKSNPSNVIKGHAYKMEWAQASSPVISANDKTSHYYNYFLGNDKSKWKGGIYAFHQLEYKGIYPGISVSFYTNDDEKLKYEYLVSPGFNPAIIQQQYTGGVELSLRQGNLVIKTNVGEIQEQKPVAWQIINGEKKLVPCSFKLVGNVVSYVFPKGYNNQFDLIIDPVLIFGSYSGSTADNFGMTATYDNTGHLYAGGIAFNPGYPTTVGAWDNTANPVNGSLAANYGTADVVITKYLPNGTNLVYSTYLGGGGANFGTETVHSLIVNDNDELYCFGVTSSTDFPTTTFCYDNTFNGGQTIGFYYNGEMFGGGTDIWVTKFNAAGSNLLGSTFIGGTGNDGVNYNQNVPFAGFLNSAADSLQSNYGDQFRGEIMLDAAGNCYVASTTKSSDFPTMNGFQNTFGGKQDGVVFKFDSNLTGLIWSSYIGGTEKDAAYSVKLDANDNVFVAGGTISSDFVSTPGTLNTTFQGGKADGYIIKIDPSGASLLASTFIGTASYDQTYFIEVDRFDEVYIYGQTLGAATYPIVNVAYSNPNSGQFITKLDNNLTGIIYSTLFGNGNGNVNLSPAAFLVDVCGNVYISGWGANILQATPLSGMPVTPGAFQTSNGDGFNFYLAVFERNMNSLLYATYFGGGISHEHVDGGTSRFDKYGIVYQSVCAGCGGNDDFPTTPGAWSNTNNSTSPSNCNNGVFKFDFEISPEADFTVDNLAGCAPLTITFTNTSPSTLPWLWDFGNGDTTSLIYSPVKTYPDTGTFIVYLIVEDSICGLKDTAVKIITVYPELVIVTSDTSLCNPQSLLLVSSSNGLSPWFVWSSNGNFTDTLNNPVTDSTLLVNVSSDTSFYVQSYSPYCYKGDTVTIDLPELNPVFINPGGCAGDLIPITANNAFSGQTYTIDWAPDSLVVSGEGTSTITTLLNYSNWYYVTFTDLDGCSITDSVFVTVSGPPGTVSATANPVTISAGMSSQLTASPSGFTYSWFPSLFLDNPNIQNPIATPPTSMWYIVTVSNNGCPRSDSVFIEVINFICDENHVYVPNAFTPNNDGKNDKLFVRSYTTPDFKVEIEFKVFDRWGEKVFETTDVNVGWDGKFKNRDADPAVFDYYLKATCPGGEEYFKKGNVTLIR